MIATSSYEAKHRTMIHITCENNMTKQLIKNYIICSRLCIMIINLSFILQAILSFTREETIVSLFISILLCPSGSMLSLEVPRVRL